MDLLGCSVQTLRNHEYRGKLHVQFAMRADPQGVLRRTAVYNPKELANLPKYAASVIRSPGEITARSFELFREGKSILDVVLIVREETSKVRALYEEWLDAGGSNLVIAPEAQEALQELWGPFASVAELVDLNTKVKTAIESVIGPCAGIDEIVAGIRKLGDR